MSKRRRNRQSRVPREIILPDGRITTPPGSPKILIHTRRGQCVGIYCNQPAKILQVETRDDPRRTADPAFLAGLEILSPQTSVKVVDGYGTSVDHMLAMQFDDPSMDEDLRTALAAHEVVLEDEWPDIW